MSAIERRSGPGAGAIRTHRRARHGLMERLGGGLQRVLLTCLAGLVLAGMVHICAVLLVPHFASRDAGAAYAALGAAGAAELVSGRGSSLPELRDADPATVTAICSYDLSAGPMRISARSGALPLGLTLHRRGGGVVYAVTDRAAIRGVLEFVVLTEEQLGERLDREDENDVVRELRIVSDAAQGLVVARVLAKLPSDRAEAEALATGVACGLAD